jgi:cytochrome c-type biogenesis protein CcmH
VSAAPKRGVARWAPWIALAVVVVVTLAIGTFAQDEPTDAERAQALAETIRCPTCKSQAVASSDTPSSKAVRELITDRIEAGNSVEEIRDYVAAQFPDQDLLLDPSGSGFSALVWALPAMFVVAAVAGLAIRFIGYRTPALAATDDDRRLVDEALGEDGGSAPAPDDGDGPEGDDRSEGDDGPEGDEAP